MDPRQKTTVIRVPDATVPSASVDRQALKAGRAQPSRRRRSRWIWMSAAAALLIGMACCMVWMATFYATDETAADVHEVSRFAHHAAPLRELAVSFDGKIVASGDGSGLVRLWHPENREEIGRIPSATEQPVRFALSADGQMVAVCGRDSGVRLWRHQQWDEGVPVVLPPGDVRCLAIHPNQNYLLVGCEDGRLHLWDVLSNKIVQVCKLTAGIRSMAMLPDGKRFLVGDAKGSLRLWHLSRVKELVARDAHQADVMALALSGDGSRVLSCGGDGAVHLWDVDQLSRIATLAPPAHRPASIALSLGGTRAMVGDAAGGLHLYSCETNKIVLDFTGHAGSVGCCQFMPNGLIGLSGSEDKSVRLWRLPVPTALENKQAEAAIELTNRRFTKMMAYRKRLEAGQQAKQQERLEDALAELRQAEAMVDADTLEHNQAHAAIRELETALDKKTRYTAHLKAGKEAADRKDFHEALRQAELAKQAYPDGSEAIEMHDKAEEAWKTERAFNDAQFKRTLTFAEPMARPIRLSDAATYAFLLPEKTKDLRLASTKDMPLGLTDAPLLWTLRTELSVKVPEAAKVALRVELSGMESGRVIADVLHPFVVGERRQFFRGTARAPKGGWKSGSYRFRTFQVVDGETTPKGDAQTFQIATIHWEKTTLEVSPAAVLNAGLMLDGGVEVDQYDGVSIVATGTTIPADLPFYRDLMSDGKLAVPPRSPPTGLPWSTNDQILRKYRVIELTGNFAALLVRIGAREWIPYQDLPCPIPAPYSGKIWLSLNSVVPLTEAPPGAARQRRKDDRFWREDAGKYDVQIFRGRFNFPMKLLPLERTAILQVFEN